MIIISILQVDKWRLREVIKLAQLRKQRFYDANSGKTDFNIHKIIIILCYNSILFYLWATIVLYQNYAQWYDAIFFLN